MNVNGTITVNVEDAQTLTLALNGTITPALLQIIVQVLLIPAVEALVDGQSYCYS